MTKFIKLTECGQLKRTFVLNVETIEYVLPMANGNGTEVVTNDHHTKYGVVETMDDILDMLRKEDLLIELAKETAAIMETE